MKKKERKKKKPAHEVMVQKIPKDYDTMKKIRDISDKLKDTDLVGTIRQFERNQASGVYLYEVVKTTAEIYGSEYVIKLGREMVSNPQHPRFNLRANSVMVARYWMLYIGKMYRATRKKRIFGFHCWLSNPFRYED